MARGGWFRKLARNGASQPAVPEGLWTKCPRCGEILFARDVERNFNVCPKCEHHHRISVERRLELTVDEGSFEEMDGELASVDPLNFPEYADKRARAEEKTGLKDSLVTGRARIEGRALILGLAEFAFMGGSMGSVTGEKIARAMETAERERLPMVMFTGNGGGARMHEGLF